MADNQNTKIQFKRKTSDAELANIALNEGEPLFIPALDQLRIGKKNTGGTASDTDTTILGPASLAAKAIDDGAQLVFTNSNQTTKTIDIKGSDNLSITYSNDGEKDTLQLNGTANVIIKDNPTEPDITALGSGSTNSIGIVKRSIGNSTEKYSYTAYVHNGSEWKAMDGNYSADNVYFSEDFLVTTTFGNKVASDTNAQTIEAKGESLSSLFTKYWSTANTAQPTQPAITNFSITGYTTDSGTDEIGSTVTAINYSTSVTRGSYKYGAKITYTDGSAETIKDVNMTPTYTITSTNIEGNKTEATGTAVDLKGNGVYLNTLSSTDICTLAASVTFSNKYVVGGTVGGKTVQSVEVLNSLQQPVTSIEPLGASYTKTASDTLPITPFRYSCFYRLDTTNSITTTNINSVVTSSYLRNGTKGSNTTFDINVTSGVKSIVIAVKGSSARLTRAYNNTVNADMLNGFTKATSTVNVSGYTAGSDETPYTIFYYTPDVPYTTSANISISVSTS